MTKQTRTPGEYFEVRLVRSQFDGYVFAVCSKGSWKPITTLRDLAAARVTAGAL